MQQGTYCWGLNLGFHTQTLILQRVLRVSKTFQTRNLIIWFCYLCQMQVERQISEDGSLRKTRGLNNLLYPCGLFEVQFPLVLPLSSFVRQFQICLLSASLSHIYKRQFNLAGNFSVVHREIRLIQPCLPICLLGREGMFEGHFMTDFTPALLESA